MLKAKASAINRQIAELKQELIDLIRGLPDASDIVKISSNCGIVSLNTVIRNNFILSPAYYMGAEIKEVLTAAVNRASGAALEGLIEGIISKQSYQACNRTQPIHPDIINKIKEIWYGHGKD